MKRILLDTSAYSAFMGGHPEVLQALQEADEIYLSPIVLGELQAGFQKGTQTKKNQKELETFLDSPRVILLSLDSETAERYAVILNALWRIGKPIPTNDLWIAASAMQQGLTLLTLDAHFLNVTQILVNFIRA